MGLAGILFLIQSAGEPEDLGGQMGDADGHVLHDVPDVLHVPPAPAEGAQVAPSVPAWLHAGRFRRGPSFPVTAAFPREGYGAVRHEGQDPFRGHPEAGVLFGRADPAVRLSSCATGREGARLRHHGPYELPYGIRVGRSEAEGPEQETEEPVLVIELVGVTICPEKHHHPPFRQRERGRRRPQTPHSLHPAGLSCPDLPGGPGGPLH